MLADSLRSAADLALPVGDGAIVLPQLDKLLADKRLTGNLVRLDADGKAVKVAGARAR